MKNVASKVIVGGVLLYGCTAKQLLAYFRTILGFLKHHPAIIKLKNCTWFQGRCDYVVIYVAADGTQLAQPKN